MNRYSIRPAAIDDIQKVYGLIAKQNTLDYGHALLTLSDLQKRWQDIDLQTDTCVAVVDGELAGYAELLCGDSPFIYLAERTNIDLGTQLLNILEEKATRNGEAIELGTRVSEKNQTLIQLFAKSGYETKLSFLIMELEMKEPPASPQWLAGIQVRAFIMGQDEQATYQADEEASKDKGYHRPLDFDGWGSRMGLNHERFDPSLWFLACAKNKIVGFALNIYDKDTNVIWVDHLGVRRMWRNKGIGKALLLHTFGEAYRRDITHVKLSVDSKSLTNAPRLYESVGMKTVQEYHIYKKIMASK